MRSDHFWARLSFSYGELGALDRGRVVTLKNYKNDSKLLRLGYLQELAEGARTVKCRECEAEFIEEHFVNKHMERRHPRDVVEDAIKDITKGEGRRVINKMISDPTYAPPVAPDTVVKDPVDSEVKESPLYLDKTEASYKAGLNVADITGQVRAIEKGNGGKAAVLPTVTGKDLLKWRVEQGLSRETAGKVLGIGTGSIKRAEKLGGKPLGPKLGPALQSVMATP